MSNINSPICLCQNTLTKYNSQSWTCANCVREISKDNNKSIYACIAADCIYKHNAQQIYVICEECYNSNETTNNDNNNMDEVEFICNKLLSSLNTISCVFYH